MKYGVKLTVIDSLDYDEMEEIANAIRGKGYKITIVDNGNFVCEKDTSSTNRVKGCGKKWAHLNGYSVCGDNELCEDCEKLNQSVTEKALKTIKEANKGDRILWDEKEGIVKNLDKFDIHSQNKELLDKDYDGEMSTNNIDTDEVNKVFFANTTNKVGDKHE